MGNPNNFLTTLSPWQPEQDKVRLALFGKHMEELNECGAITARCLIQGIDEHEPVTNESNRENLENEIADVMATSHLIVLRFALDKSRMDARMWAKARHLGGWHHMLEDAKFGSVAERIFNRVADESPFGEKSSYTLETLRRVLAEEL